ncbi:MAG: NAD(P)H-dependent glycerol-3-phosphate dehydrogenase [Cytophagales bacterium]|nr:NAD(P)H-dependent glycerol-3-phosphate dehydrogenase [Cytophagales bacterium]
MISKKVLTTNVAVIGGGSWATALVKILCENDVKVKWWLRNSESVNYVKHFHHNPKYLSDVQLNMRKVKPDNNIKKVVQETDYVILAVPSAFVKEALKPLKSDELKGRVIVSGIKGIIPASNMLITDYLEREYYLHEEDMCVIGGPCHSEEVALEKQSYLTVGCKDYNNAIQFSNLLTCRYVKCNAITDVAGIEYCAIMKNIISILTGIVHGLGYGDNFIAVLISNAMQEVKKFLDTAHPSQRDLFASAYLGDLLVTSYSQFSRNRMFGSMLGRGYSVKAAHVEMNMIAEGYYAVKSMMDIVKRYDADMPILRGVYHILYEKVSPATEIQILKNLLK